MWPKLLALNPWVILAVVVALAGSHTLVYSKGKSRAEGIAAKAQLKAVEQAIEQAQVIAKQDMEVATANIKTVEVIRDRIRTIRVKEAAHAKTNPLPADCVLDATRMLNIQSALSGNTEAASDTSQPDYRMPKTTKLER